MLGGRLPETENKRIYQISGPKSGRSRFGNLGSGRLRESFETAFDWETKGLFVKWSLAGGGRLREAVTMRELTVVYLPKNTTCRYTMLIRELICEDFLKKSSKKMV